MGVSKFARFKDLTHYGMNSNTSYRNNIALIVHISHTDIAYQIVNLMETG